MHHPYPATREHTLFSLDSTGKTLSLECGSDLRDYQKLIRETKLANAYARK